MDSTRTDLPACLSVAPDGHLVFDGFSCEKLVTRHGVRTPMYVYSARQIRANYQRMCEAFQSRLSARWRIFYAYKGNSSPAICQILHNKGAGAEVISYGEMKQALAHHVSPDNIVFNNVVKTDRELELAVDAGVHLIIVDSETELDALERIATARGRQVNIGFRVRPGITAGFHEHVRTADDNTKFGFSREALANILPRAKDSKVLRVRAVHVHLGSQINDVAKYEQAARFAFDLTSELRSDHGFPIDIVDLGGGMGIQDETGNPVVFDFAALAQRIQQALEASLGTNRNDWPMLYFEPNRALVGNAGILLGRVVSRKKDVGRLFVGTDIGYSAFVRPMLYGARHKILSVKNPFPDTSRTCDVVGPLCETGDVVGKGVSLPNPEVGDILAVLDAGSYGFVQASRYSSLPLPGEYLIDNETVYEIRTPETYDDLQRLSRIPDHLNPNSEGMVIGSPASFRPS